jgi:phage-related protein
VAQSIKGEKLRAKGSIAAPAKAVARISFEGDSYDVLCSWPKSMRLDFGHALREMQNGREATLEVRPMPSIGPSVYELKDSDDKTWYRVMYLARKDDVIHVLDCFEKNVTKTLKKDIKKATVRLSHVKQRLMEEQKDAKRKAKQ